MEGREPELRLFDSSEELDSCLADYVYQISESAVNERGSFSLVISGGDMANRLGFFIFPIFFFSYKNAEFYSHPFQVSTEI